MKENVIIHRILNSFFVIVSISLLLAINETPSIVLGQVPLHTGVWKIKANGFKGDLNIQTVGSDGRLKGTVTFVNTPEQQITGFWDEPSQKITFMRIINPNDASTIQVYTGYQFCIPSNCASTGQNALTLTGYFEAFSGTGGTAQRSVYGWYAETTIIG